MLMIRWRHPELRVLCRTYNQTDVIDSAGELWPQRTMIAPSEGNRMDMRGMPK